ncbi:MAG: hypothetical protein ACYTGQ_09755 [Planctomycetota bacterium]|jgi:hypothetical protein
MRKIKHTWQNVNGLITLPDLFNVVGFWLYRGTMRRTVYVAIPLIFLAVVDGNLKKGHALTGTSIVLVVSFLGGLLLMSISGSFAKKQLTLAEAKGANLLEDMKKDRADIHCAELWRRVFRYESDIATPEEIENETRLIADNRRDLHRACLPEPSRDIEGPRLDEVREVLKQLGHTQDGFRIIFQYATQAPMSRYLMKHRLRFDLTKVRDWYDGAPFHPTDRKLAEQFNGSEALQEVKAQVRLGWRGLLPYKSKRTVQGMWFKVVVRAIQLRVANACLKLDETYPGHHFSPDQFLWPSEETHRLVEAHSGPRALADLYEMRRLVFHRVLCPDRELAQSLMQKTIYPNFEIDSLLRRLYDPQYLLAQLDEDWEQDLLHYDRAFKNRFKHERKRRGVLEAAMQSADAYARYLAAHPDALEGADPEARRAIRIAVHINHEGLSDHIEVDDHEEMLRVIHGVIENKRRFTVNLLAVRTHHELTRLELEDYEFYIDRILEESPERRIRVSLWRKRHDNLALCVPHRVGDGAP